jgi:predicted O-methyltransferase YrrM
MRAGRLLRSFRGGSIIFDNFVVAYFTDRARRVRFVNAVLGFSRHEELKAVFPSEEMPAMLAKATGLTIRFPDMTYAPGNISFAEVSVLAALANALHARRIFEFGTFNGNTAYHLAVNTDPECQVYTLDIPPGVTPSLHEDAGDAAFRPETAVHHRWDGTDVAPRVHQLLCDSARLDPTPYAGTMDLVFVDGSHSKEYIENDTRLALRMVRPGGVIVWHDYLVWNDVTTFLQEFCLTRKLSHVAGTSLALYQVPE